MNENIEDTRLPKEYKQCHVCDSYFVFNEITLEWECPLCGNDDDE